jgi:hypothetical protein
MYILIDREHLVFRHKHSDHITIQALAHIEVAHCATFITPIDSPVNFLRLTDLELRMLYQNTTGQKLDGFSRVHMNESVLAVARSVPESDVRPAEVRQQADKISMDDSGFYRYVKGASKAAKLQELFLPKPLHAEAPAPGTLAATGSDHATAAPTVPAKTPSAPKGGNRAVIWEVADRLWNDAGQPKNAQTVLQLRKTIMAELENSNGIKKTTSSTALGEWQKLRLNN